MPAMPGRVACRAVFLGLCAMLAALPGGAQGTAPECERAGAEAEAAMQLPPGLLRAIGLVESGRRDTRGGFAPWPHTINARGEGRFFETAAEAVTAVRALQAAGTASIDVGCFQVNLLHHPQAFRRLEDGFDPAANAAYAALFLRSLHQRLGSWEGAVAAYHSASPERGDAYRARVYAAWSRPDSGRAGLGALAVAGRPASVEPGRVRPVVIRIAGADPAEAAAIRVWTPSRPGAAPGRIALPAVRGTAEADPAP